MFCQIHRSYVVNLHKVFSYSGKDLVMEDQTVLPVSRNRRETLKEALLRSMAGKAAWENTGGQVMILLNIFGSALGIFQVSLVFCLFARYIYLEKGFSSLKQLKLFWEIAAGICLVCTACQEIFGFMEDYLLLISSLYRSAKAQSMEESQQSAVFLILPLLLLIVGQVSGPYAGQPVDPADLSLVCIGIAWILLKRALKGFTYERLLG